MGIESWYRHLRALAKQSDFYELESDKASDSN
jgi:hypothetical protein